MTKIRLPYVQAFRDTGGRMRYYFRRTGSRRVALPGSPGSHEFMAAYQAAMRSQKLPDARGTLAALIADFYGSTRWKQLKPSTKVTYRGILERLRTQHGEKPVARLQREHVIRMVDERADMPAAASNMLKLLRLLMERAIDTGLRPDDPTMKVRAPKQRRGGFHTWTEAEIDQFEAHWLPGTRERLAFALLLYTGQRRSDVVRMGRQHLRDGELTISQQKTGTEVTIPPHPALSSLLPDDRLIFLLTSFNKPFTAAGFGNWFREACSAAGLPHCSAHGLRKAHIRRLAEVGGSAKEMAALGGHKTLKEVERYSEAADRKRLARSGMARLIRESSGQTVKLVSNPVKVPRK